MPKSKMSSQGDCGKNQYLGLLPPLTPWEQAISDDFMEAWHDKLSSRYKIIDRFNHGYPVQNSNHDSFVSTLEIGAGNGEHIKYEPLSHEQRASYVAVDIRKNMLRLLKARFPYITTIHADCQEKLPCKDDIFDRVIAIHVLEHLPGLPSAVDEIYRVINKQRGVFHVVIPCEGSLAYSLARKISAERFFKKRYHNMSYDWLIRREHINLPERIIEEISRLFIVTNKSFFPIPLPFYFCNLAIGMTFSPRTFKRVNRSSDNGAYQLEESFE